MIIKKVKVYPVSYNLKVPFTSAAGWTRKRSSVLVEVITNENLSGWGEANGPLLTVAKAIEEVLGPIIIGKDPLDIGVIWEQMNICRRKGTPTGAIGGIDIALWDLKGKILGIPIYKLLGGCFYEKLMPYATTIFYHENNLKSVAALESDIIKLISDGFKAVKMKVGFDVDFDIKRVSKVRELVGSDFTVMVDANQSYDFMSALRLGRTLQDLKIHWYEEPIPWISFQAYRELGEKLNIPIAGGESECDLMGFVEALRQRAVNIIQPDPSIAGGITPSLYVATLAKVFGVTFCPHSFGTIIGLSASIHLTSGFSHYAGENLLRKPVLLEWDATENIMRDEIITKGPKIVNGFVNVPSGPGLGIEVDKKAIEKFIIK